MERIIERVIRVPVEVPGPARENIIYHDREVPTFHQTSYAQLPPPLPRPPVGVRWIAVPEQYPYDHLTWNSWNDWWRSNPAMYSESYLGYGAAPPLSPNTVHTRVLNGPAYYGEDMQYYSSPPQYDARWYGRSAAEDLDAADGVMDGRFYGSRIVEQPASRYYTQPLPYQNSPSRDSYYTGRNARQPARPRQSPQPPRRAMSPQMRPSSPVQQRP